MKRKLKHRKLSNQTGKQFNITINGNVNINNNYAPQIEPPKKESWWSATIAFSVAAAKFIVGL